MNLKLDLGLGFRFWLSWTGFFLLGLLKNFWRNVFRTCLIQHQSTSTWKASGTTVFLKFVLPFFRNLPGFIPESPLPGDQTIIITKQSARSTSGKKQRPYEKLT